MTHAILVRHRQTAWNRNDRFRGHADVPLDDTGLAQAEAAARRILAQWKPSVIYAGPLSRTMKTGEATARLLKLKVEADPGLLDVDCGQWQGLTPDEARKRWPAEFEMYLHSPAGFMFPGGESLEHARTRAWGHTRELAGRYPEVTIMLVSHTALNRLILLSVLGLGTDAFWNIRQDTCAINAFEIEDDRYTLVILNETGHLLSLSAGSNPAETSKTV